MTVRVAITGTLSGLTRKQARAEIQRCSAEFSSEVNHKTNYLVTTRFDTAKAKKAQQIGVQVLSESEFFDFIEIGRFPENEKPEAPERHYPNNFPKPAWTQYPKPFELIFDYVDVDGIITERSVLVQAIGTALLSNGRKQSYLQAVDGTDSRTKTFRFDRIIGLDLNVALTQSA